MKDIELFYFEPDEFRNTGNLKDVLNSVGEKTEISTPLMYELRHISREIDREWNEVYEEVNFALENDSSAKYLETDTGLFVISESDYLSENTRSLESRCYEFLSTNR